MSSIDPGELDEHSTDAYATIEEVSIDESGCEDISININLDGEVVLSDIINSCTDASSEYKTVSIGRSSLNEVEVFPTSVLDKVVLSNLPEEEVTVTVYSLNGLVVKIQKISAEKTLTSMNLSLLSNGFYIINLSTSNELLKTVKIVKH